MIRLSISLLLALGLLAVAGGLGGWQWIREQTASPPRFDSTRAVEVEPEPRAAPEPATAPEPAALPEPEPAPPTQEIAAATEVEEEGAPLAFVPDLDPLEPEPEPALEEIEDPPAPGAASELDQSADLVRRMLSIYRRAGPR